MKPYPKIMVPSDSITTSTTTVLQLTILRVISHIFIDIFISRRYFVNHGQKKYCYDVRLTFMVQRRSLIVKRPNWETELQNTK